MTLDETGAVKSAQDYFPYGKLSRSYDNSDNNGKYKFTEKERDSETNYDYFGARYYNNDLGVWLQIDPLADKYIGYSPIGRTAVQNAIDDVNDFQSSGA